MTARLPIPGQDDGTWGSILNDYLSQSINSDGSLKSSSVAASGAEQTSNKGVANGYAGLNGSSLVPSTQLGTGSASTSTYLRGDGNWEVPPGSGGSATLAGDTDVSITSPSSGQVLTYNAGSSLWNNQTLPSAPVSSVAGRTGAITLGEADITNLTGDLAAKATDSTVVHNTGNETVGGIKTFSASPVVPTPTSVSQATNKTYVDGAVSTAQTNALLYGPVASGDTTGVTDTAALAALAADGVTIILRPYSNYYVTSLPNVTPRRGLIGLGLSTVVNHVGGGSCLTIRNPNFPTTGNPIPVFTDNTAGHVGGFIIDGTNHTGTAAAGVETGDIYALDAQDIVVRNYTAANDRAYWMNNTIGWTERAHWSNCHFDNCTQGIVWSVNGGTQSFDYSIFEFSGRSQANQDGYVFTNATFFDGSEFHLKGNFYGGVSNTGTALKIGTDNSSVLMRRITMFCQFETDGSGVGHTTINQGTAAQVSAAGILRFLSGTPTWQTGNITSSNKFAFSGLVEVDANLGINQAGEGLNVLGGSTWSKGSWSVTGGNATLFLPTGDYFNVSLATGANTLLLNGAYQGRARTLHLFLHQPSSSTATVVATSPGNNASGTTQTINGWPQLSAGNSLVDYVVLSTGDGQTWYASLQSNSLLTAPVSIPTGADGNIGLKITANSGTQSGDLQEWNNSSNVSLARINATGQLVLNQATATNGALLAQQQGDSNARLNMNANGLLQWGTGSAGTDTTFGRVAAGVAGGAALSVSGLTGATATSRYVGATASGAPTSGTFAVGDVVIDHTGVIWICTAAGTPGTWAQTGGSGVASFNSRTGAVTPTTGDYTAAQVTNAADKSSVSQQTFTGLLSAPAVNASGLTGATASAVRHVGGTSAGAPTTGTFLTGDTIIDANGISWYCTAGGSPGTWIMLGALTLADIYLKPSGVLFETASRAYSHPNSTFTPISGDLYLSAIALPAGVTIGHLQFVSVAAAGTPSHWWFGLFDNNLNALALTADQTTTAWGANSLKSLPVATVASGAASSFVTTYTGLYYMGVMQAVSAGSPATLAGSGVAALTLVSSTPVLAGLSNTAQTTPPAFPFQATALTAQTTMLYGAIS